MPAHRLPLLRNFFFIWGDDAAEDYTIGTDKRLDGSVRYQVGIRKSDSTIGDILLKTQWHQDSLSASDELEKLLDNLARVKQIYQGKGDRMQHRMGDADRWTM